jgi:uncharacterized surface protein with fasciclin (FAS1) repeats
MLLDRLLTAAAAAALIVALGAPQTAAAQTATPPAALPAAAAPAPRANPVTPAGDMVETLRHNGQFTTVIKALDTVNLTNLLKTRPGMTFFAPTDAAFAALPAGTLDRLMADKPALQKLLLHHLINATVDSSKIAGKKGPVSTGASDPMELDGSETPFKADNATIIQGDVRATNGILQIVDHVLMAAAPSATASAAPASAIAPLQGTNATVKR